MGTNGEPLRDNQWLSEQLGIPLRTIYAWRQRGEGPPAYRVGKYLRYRGSDVEAWLAERHDTAGQRAS
jgi:excisionase family DNA binding protein